MHTVEITLEQVLLARDRRVMRQRELAARYGGTLLSFTMNIAGPVKDAPLVRLAFRAGLAALDRDLGKPVHRELIQAPTGPEALLVYDRPAPWVKERCLLLEERDPVGRLYDLDVLGVPSLDYLVLTHPHADHTGNARAVLRNLPVKTLLLPLWQPTADETADWPRHLAELAADSGAEILTAEAGEEYPLGSGKLQILQGGSEDAGSVNDASLCTLFTAGDFRFLNTGDAEADAEQRLVDTYGPTLHATLFKAGHHGSYTSNSLTFMQAVRPEAVAISCGLHNDYGHPHRAALQNYAEVGAEIWRTDLEGSLTFIWQNNTLNVETSADSADFAA